MKRDEPVNSEGETWAQRYDRVQQAKRTLLLHIQHHPDVEERANELYHKRMGFWSTAPAPHGSRIAQLEFELELEDLLLDEYYVTVNDRLTNTYNYYGGHGPTRTWSPWSIVTRKPIQYRGRKTVSKVRELRLALRKRMRQLLTIQEVTK